MFKSENIQARLEALKSKLKSQEAERETLLEAAAEAELGGPATDPKSLCRISDQLADSRELINKLESRLVAALAAEKADALEARVMVFKKAAADGLASGKAALTALISALEAYSIAIDKLKAAHSATRRALIAVDWQIDPDMNSALAAISIANLSGVLSYGDRELALRSAKRVLSEASDKDLAACGLEEVRRDIARLTKAPEPTPAEIEAPKEFKCVAYDPRPALEAEAAERAAIRKDFLSVPRPDIRTRTPQWDGTFLETWNADGIQHRRTVPATAAPFEGLDDISNGIPAPSVN